jgi:hypothetical protein
MVVIEIFYILSLVMTGDTDEIYIMNEVQICIQLELSINVSVFLYMCWILSSTPTKSTLNTLPRKQ